MYGAAALTQQVCAPRLGKGVGEGGGGQGRSALWSAGLRGSWALWKWPQPSVGDIPLSSPLSVAAELESPPLTRTFRGGAHRQTQAAGKAVSVLARMCILLLLLLTLEL